MGEDEEKLLLVIDADDNASQKIDDVTKSLSDLDRQAGNMSNANGGWAKNFTKGFEDTVNGINRMTRQYNNIMTGFNRSVRNLVMDMGSAVYDFTSDSINNFTEFSEQHAKTLGAMSTNYQKTAEDQARFFQDAQRLKEQAMQFGTYGVTGQGALMDVTQVSEAQTELVKAGVDAKDITNPNSNITRDVLTFAQANDLDTASAVEFAVSLGNQFGIEKSDWGDMLDKVTHTADMSIIDVKDIVTSMKWAGGITAGLDRDLSETLAQISILGDFGLKGSQAGTGIQALLTRLLTGDTTVITAAQAEVAPGDALEKFYEFEKAAKPDGNLLPMADVIEELEAVMSDMTDEEQAWFAKKLFGLYQMKSAYALLNGDETDLNDVIKEIETQSDGANENKLNTLLESQYGQLTSLTNLWEGVKTDFGDRLNPFVDAVRDELFNVVKNEGNYDINFDNLQDALDESCTLIEEKYGSAIADATRGIGSFAIDFAQTGIEIAPALGEGLVETFNSLFRGNLLGKDSVAENWSEMISNMELAVDELPEDLQGLGDAIVGAIDWFGKLTAINVASNIAELVSSLLQILTIAGGAMINVAGGVVVNGAAVTTSAGTSYTQWGKGAGTAGTAAKGTKGASTAAKGAGTAGASVTGSTVVGTADDVAKAFGTSADDVVGMLGKQATYSVDDIAKAFGTSADDVASALGIASKNVSTLSKFGKGLGIAGIGLEVGFTGYEAYKAFSSGDDKGGTEAIAGGIGSIGGGLGGAKLGAAIGTAIAPGIGTAIGGVLGAIGGSLFGDWAGEKVGGSIYDAANPGSKIDGTKRLTTKGEEYSRYLSELHAQYDALVEAGQEDSVAAYKLKNQINELDDAFNAMGDLTIAGLISKTEQLATTVDSISEIQLEKNTATETAADQAKSYVAALDALPENKDDKQKQLAQDMIDWLNAQYNMDLEMDENGKYNMTTSEMWDAINNSTKQEKMNASEEALVGYLAQYQTAQETYAIADATEDEARTNYNHASDKNKEARQQEWFAALDAQATAREEFDNLSESIRKCYAEMGYTETEINQMMEDLAEKSAKSTEIDTYTKEKELGMHEDLNIEHKNEITAPELVKEQDAEVPTYNDNNPFNDARTQMDYLMVKKEFPELAGLGEALTGVGSLTAQQWTLALSHDNGKSEYEKLANDDRIAFKNAWITAFGEASWDDLEADFEDKRTHEQKYIDTQSLGKLMINITPNNEFSQYYNKSFDTSGGYGYNVWTGTKEQYETWSKDGERLTDGSTDQPYMLDDIGLDDSSKDKIIKTRDDGLGSYYSFKDSEFDGLMVKITPDNEFSQYYDKSFDNRGYGYNVWTGTAQEYEVWSSKQHFVVDDDQNLKGDVTNAYILNEMDISQDHKDNIIKDNEEALKNKKEPKVDKVNGGGGEFGGSNTHMGSSGESHDGGGGKFDYIDTVKAYSDARSGKNDSETAQSTKNKAKTASEIVDDAKNKLNNGETSISDMVNTYKELLSNSGVNIGDGTNNETDYINTVKAYSDARSGKTSEEGIEPLSTRPKSLQIPDKTIQVNQLSSSGGIKSNNQTIRSTRASNTILRQMVSQPLNVINKATSSGDNKDTTQTNFDGIADACKDGIIQGLDQSTKNETKMPNVYPQPLDINTNNKATQGEIRIPYIFPQPLNLSNKTQNGTKTPSIASQPINLGKATQDNTNQIDLGDISKACKDGIIQGLGQYKENKEASKDNQMNAGEVNINTASSTLTGEVKIPNIVSQQMMFPQPFNGGNGAIQNEINNQINIDDTITMQPQFTVSAPNVNVDVNVDQSGRVAKSVSILNPGQGTLLNNWYSRTSSQYGKTTK